MQFLSMLTLMIMFLFIGCQINENDPVSPTTETITMEKTAPPPNTPFPYLQEFLFVNQMEYCVNGTDIIVEIQNRNIFNRGSNFFVEINYANGKLMVYLNKPSTMTFTIPYFGTPDITSIELYCIMEY